MKTTIIILLITGLVWMVFWVYFKYICGFCCSRNGRSVPLGKRVEAMKTFMLWLLSVGMLVSGFLLYEHHKAIVRLSLENGRLHRQLYARTITLDQLERRMFLLVGDLETLSDEVLERCRIKEPRPPMVMKARKK